MCIIILRRVINWKSLAKRPRRWLARAITFCSTRINLVPKEMRGRRFSDKARNGRPNTTRLQVSSHVRACASTPPVPEAAVARYPPGEQDAADFGEDF